MKHYPRGTSSLTSFIAVVALIGATGAANQARAAEGEQIYVLAERSVQPTGGDSSQYSFGPMGTVAGARRGVRGVRESLAGLGSVPDIGDRGVTDDAHAYFSPDGRTPGHVIDIDSKRSMG